MGQNFVKTGALYVALLIVTLPVLSQAQANWSGQVQCQLTDQDQTYSRQELQTWLITGAAPTMQGGISVYPATWSVTGQGALQRAQGGQITNIQWTANVPPMQASIAIFVRGSDNRLIVKPWHSQQRMDNALNGMRQIVANGVAQQPTDFSKSVWEWQFPRIEDSPTNTNVTGSTQSQAESGDAELLHHYGSMPPAATCRWQFIKGGIAITNGNSGAWSGGQSNQNSQSSMTANTNSPNNGQNCESPAAVQQSFENMKSTVQAQYNQLITGTSDPSQVASLTSQEQRMLANLNNQEQHDMNAVAQGCLQPNNQSTGGGNSYGSNQNGNNNQNTGNNPYSGGSQSFGGNQYSGNGQNGHGQNNGNNPYSGINPNSGGPYSGSNQNSGNSQNSGNNQSGANPGMVALPSGVKITAAPAQQHPNTSLAASAGNARALGPAQAVIPTSAAQITQINPTVAQTLQTVSVTLTGKGTHFVDGRTNIAFLSPQVMNQAPIKLVNSYTQATQPSSSDGTTPSPDPNSPSGDGTTPSPDPNSPSGDRTTPSSDPNSPSGDGTTAGFSTNNAAPLSVASHLQVNSVKVTSPTSATVTITIPSSASGPYSVAATTPVTGSQSSELATLSNGFTVVQQTSGNYRVTMTGLMCVKGITRGEDAIYGAAVIRQYDRSSGQAKMFTNANTWVYGDINGMIGQRIQAGRGGPLGGIVNGDFVPSGFMVGPKDSLPPQSNLFPMALFQGTLTNGIDALVISPSLWISYGDNSMFFNWNQTEDSLTNSMFVDSHVQSQINTQAFGPLFFGASQNVSGSAASSVAGASVVGATEELIQASGLTFGIPVGIFGITSPSHDRPIGVAEADKNNPTSNTVLPNATLVLTREIIEKQLGSNTWTTMSFNFNDDPFAFSPLPNTDRPGAYTMFIQIERQ